MFSNTNKEVIKRISNKSFRHNQLRNLFALAAILLTTVLLTTIFTCGISFYKTYDFYGKMGKGVDYHGYLRGDINLYEKVLQHKDVKKAGFLADLATSYIRSKDVTGKTFYLKYADPSLFEMNYVKPIKGDYPKTSDDLLVPMFLLDLLSMPYEIDQQITLNVPITEEGKEVLKPITFNICGYYKEVIPATSNYGELYSGSDFIETYNPELPEGLSDIYIQAKSLHTFSSYTRAEEVLEKIQRDVNGAGGSMAISPDFYYMSSSDMTDLFTIFIPVLCMALLIIICGYFLIYNIFDISVVNDIQFYGLLKTIGTTRDQIKRLMKKQVFLLSMISIPVGLVIGYVIGVVFTPRIIAMTNFKDFMQISKSPVIFILSALFAWFTVLISCRKPIKKASKISPVEAAKYVGEVGNTKLKYTKSTKSTKKNNIYRMGFSNILRNKKKTTVTVISISLAAAIFIVVCNVTIGYDAYKISDRYGQSDIKLYHHTSKWSQEVPYEPMDYNLYERIQDLDIVEKVDIYYMGRTIPDYLDLADNTKLYFSIGELKAEGLLKEEIDSIIQASGDNRGGNNGLLMNEKDNARLSILGVPASNVEMEVKKSKVVSGTIDQEKFATGEYILFQSPNKFYRQGEKGGNIIKAGDKMNLSIYEYTMDRFVDREFTVMAVIKDDDMFSQYNIGSNNIIMTNKVFEDIYSNYKEQIAALEIYTKDHLSEKNVNVIKRMVMSTGNFQIKINSKYEQLQHFKKEKQSIAIMGYGLSAIIGLIGILNMINTLVTSILMRRKEIAALQSIGMTRKQVKKMLIAEGGSLTVLSLIIILPISLALSVGISNSPMFAGFNMNVFTLSLGGTGFLLFAFSVIIASIMTRIISKESVVERLRITS